MNSFIPKNSWIKLITRVFGCRWTKYHFENMSGYILCHAAHKNNEKKQA